MINLGRIPVCVSSSPCLGGPRTTNGHREQQNSPDDRDPIKKSQQKFGNNCGHDPKMPRFYTRPVHYKNRFHVLEEAQRVIKQALADPFSYPELHELLVNKDKDGRKHRSERVEAEMYLLVPAIFDSVNLVNMQVGHYTTGQSFINYNYSYFEKRTGMSSHRVERNMRHLQKYGLIHVQKIIKTLNDGAKRTDRVIITVSNKLFEIFRLTDKFLDDRAKAFRNHAKNKKRLDDQNKYRSNFKPILQKDKRENRKTLSSIGDLASKMTNFSSRSSDSTKVYNPLQDKRVLSLIKDVMTSDPSLTLSQASKIVLERIKSPPDG
jgi:hypothetical protein